MKFEKDDISDTMHPAALFAKAPEAVFENRVARDLDNCTKVRCMTDDMIRDKREARGVTRFSGAGNQPTPDVDQLKLGEMMSGFAEEASEGGSDTSSVQQHAESLSASVQTFNSASKGRSKGKGKKGSVDPRSFHGRSVAGHIAETECGGQPPAVAAALRKKEGALKNKGKGKGKERSGGKAKGKGKNMLRVRRRHPVSLCSSVGWDNDLEEDAPEGEDTNEDGCWTEEDDETLQVEYFGSDSCSMSSPSGLRDGFSQAGWTMVTRKSRIRQQCDAEHCGTMTAT